MTVAAIDLGKFVNGDASDRRSVADDLDAACRDVGFLTLVNHGVSADLLEGVLGVCEQFFDLPIDVKRRYVDPVTSNNRAYAEMGTEALAYSFSSDEVAAPDLFEAFNVGRSDTTGPYYDQHRRFYAPNIWPDVVPGFRQTLGDYLAELRKVTDSLLELFAVALRLDPMHLVDRTRHAVITARAINYERRSGDVEPVRGQMRMGAHTDYGILTVLLADNVAGLEIHRGGNWIPVPITSGAFIVNLGDMLARWSNDRWVSTMHRVVPPPSGDGGPVRRRSLAQFVEADPDCLLECFETCIAPGETARYEPVLAGEYLLSKLMGPRELRPSSVVDLA